MKFKFTKNYLYIGLILLGIFVGVVLLGQQIRLKSKATDYTAYVQLTPGSATVSIQKISDNLPNRNVGFVRLTFKYVTSKQSQVVSNLNEDTSTSEYNVILNRAGSPGFLTIAAGTTSNYNNYTFNVPIALISLDGSQIINLDLDISNSEVVDTYGNIYNLDNKNLTSSTSLPFPTISPSNTPLPTGAPNCQRCSNNTKNQLIKWYDVTGQCLTPTNFTTEFNNTTCTQTPCGDSSVNGLCKSSCDTNTETNGSGVCYIANTNDNRTACCIAKTNITPTVTPTPLPTPTGFYDSNTTVQLKLRLQYINSKKADRTVQVRITQNNVSTTHDVSIAADNNGVFTGTFPAKTGGAVIMVKEATHLRGGVALTLTGDFNAVDMRDALLRAGDVNGDNAISQIDLVKIINDWTSPNTAINTNSAKSDINEDGVINIKDVASFITNWTAINVYGSP